MKKKNESSEQLNIQLIFATAYARGIALSQIRKDERSLRIYMWYAADNDLRWSIYWMGASVFIKELFRNRCGMY